MEEKQKCKECWNCANYEAYYTKGSSQFNKTKIGFCRKHAKILSKHEACEFWRYYSKIYGIRKSVSTRVLYDLLSHISAIRQIIQEEKEEQEDNE